MRVKTVWNYSIDYLEYDINQACKRLDNVIGVSISVCTNSKSRDVYFACITYDENKKEEE